MCAGPAASLFPQCPCRGRLFTVAADVHVFITGESLQCFLAGWCTNKSYVIATSDLWLFIHASNLLPSLPTPTTPTNLAPASRIGSRSVTHRPGYSVEELSGGRSSGPDHHQHGRATAVASDPATEVTTPMNLFRRRSASSGTSVWRKEQQWSG